MNRQNLSSQKRVFVDSNYFVALNNPEDNLNTKARRIATDIKGKNTSLVISNYIFLEITTVLSQRVGKQIALSVGKQLIDSNIIEVILIDKSLHHSSWEIFQKAQKKNVSFVDASIVAVMKSENIRNVISFDKELKTFKEAYKFNYFV